MKVFKLYTGLFIAICFSIPSGCSDIPTSVKTDIPSMNKDQITNRDTALIEHTFKATYRLEPGETLNLDNNNTEMVLIQSFSVSNCGTVRRDLLIQTSTINAGNGLPCEWDCGPGLMLEDLSIENVSEQTKKIEVKIAGFKLHY